MQMLMTGEPISAQEAHRLGMVNQVCAQGDLKKVAMEIAEKIARNSPTAVQAVKHAVKTTQREPLEQAIAIMMEDHWISVQHPDRLEGRSIVDLSLRKSGAVFFCNCGTYGALN
jgi:enoyl-CoA hydratase